MVIGLVSKSKKVVMGEAKRDQSSKEFKSLEAIGSNALAVLT